MFYISQKTVSNESLGLLRGGDRARQSERHHSANSRLRGRIFRKFENIQVSNIIKNDSGKLLLKMTFDRERDSIGIRH
jgi:hypothetical protein